MYLSQQFLTKKKKCEVIIIRKRDQKSKRVLNLYYKKTRNIDNRKII
jgi:hypothetical protein